MESKSSLNNRTPLAYFKQFNDHITGLRNEVEKHNTQQNNIYQLCNQSESEIGKQQRTKQSNRIFVKNKKLLLKSMTQPKHHYSVIKHLTQREKQWALAKQKNTRLLKRNSSIKKVYKNIWSNQTDMQQINKSKQKNNLPNLEETEYVSQILPRSLTYKQNESKNMNESNINSCKSQSRIRISVKRKQKKLEEQWTKTQIFRNNMNITDRLQSQSSVCYLKPIYCTKQMKRQKQIIEKVRKNRPGTCMYSYNSRVQSDLGYASEQIGLRELR